MGLRVCLVTPFAWSKPHEVNEHVAGVARALRLLGHTVTILAPSGRSADLRAGRRALAQGGLGEVVAVGPAIPVSRRSSMATTVGVRANLALALELGDFDIVHGFEPGLPSLSYLALRDTKALAVATFFSPDRLFYPPGKRQRARLLARVDALLAVSAGAAQAATVRFPGDYTLVPHGTDVDLFRPVRKSRRIAVEIVPGAREPARDVIRVLDELPAWEITLLRRRPRGTRPYVPLRLRGRVHVRSIRDLSARAAQLNGAAIFVPARDGNPQLALDAAAAGAVSAADAEQVLSLARDDERRGRFAARERAKAEAESFEVVAARLDQLYRQLGRRHRPRRARAARRTADWIVCDLHTHTSWSHDCSVSPTDLLDVAEELGLGAIAVTDHNVFGGALEAVELARGRNLVVIPGEEVKTDSQGEVIGFFLQEEIPRRLSFAETVTAIHDQGGLVYLPHPFDRRHAIPDPATLHRHLAVIDVLEVFNARLMLDTYNDEALRFARKYNLLQGAGSDAHVLQGIGTGAVRMRPFDGPQEFLASLRSAEILRRPKSLAYLQSLKWVAQVKEKVR